MPTPPPPTPYSVDIQTDKAINPPSSPPPLKASVGCTCTMAQSGFSLLCLATSLYLGSKVYMMASTVSSKFIRAMAESEGFHFVVSSSILN